MSANEIDQRRLILLEEGHCLRDQALAYCAAARHEMPLSLGATSLTTVMQMVANGYGVTLVPEVAVDVEVRDERVKLLRFAAPEPGRTIGLAWRRTSPRKADFFALGQIVTEVLGARANAKPRKRAALGRLNKKGGLSATFGLDRSSEADRSAIPRRRRRFVRLVAAFGLLLGFEVLAGLLIDDLHRQPHLAAIVEAEQLDLHLVAFLDDVGWSSARGAPRAG